MSKLPDNTDDRITLESLRTRIEEIDKRLFKDLVRRARIAARIGVLKRRQKEPWDIYSPRREKDLLNKLCADPEAYRPLHDSWLRGFYKEIFSISRALQYPAKVSSSAPIYPIPAESVGAFDARGLRQAFAGEKVAYLGPEGTFTFTAARAIFASSTDDVAPALLCDSMSFDDIIDALKGRRCGAAVIPVVNSTTGAIMGHYLRVEEENLMVLFEQTQAVSHNLWTTLGEPDLELEQIKEIFAHPQAIEQCARWLTRHCPHATYRHYYSSMSAIKALADPAESGRARGAAAAIAPSQANAHISLRLLADHIEDNEHNETIFWVVTSDDRYRRLSIPGAGDRPATDYHTYLSCYLADRPGALRDLGALFAHWEPPLNMTYIQSFQQSSPSNPDYRHLFKITVDRAFDHDRLIEQASECGIILKFRGRTLKARTE